MIIISLFHPLLNNLINWYSFISRNPADSTFSIFADNSFTFVCSFSFHLRFALSYTNKLIALFRSKYRFCSFDQIIFPLWFCMVWYPKDHFVSFLSIVSILFELVSILFFFNSVSPNLPFQPHVPWCVVHESRFA